MIEDMPISEAAWYGRTAIMRSLLEAQANIDAVTTGGPGPGMSALMIAVMRGQVGAVRVLLHAGANKEIKDEKGRNAFDYAREGGRRGEAEHIMELLS